MDSERVFKSRGEWRTKLLFCRHGERKISLWKKVLNWFFSLNKKFLSHPFFIPFNEVSLSFLTHRLFIQTLWQKLQLCGTKILFTKSCPVFGGSWEWFYRIFWEHSSKIQCWNDPITELPLPRSSLNPCCHPSNIPYPPASIQFRWISPRLKSWCWVKKVLRFISD